MKEQHPFLDEIIRLAAFAGLVARVPYDQGHAVNFGELWEQAAKGADEIRERRKEAALKELREAVLKKLFKSDEALKKLQELLEYKPRFIRQEGECNE